MGTTSQTDQNASIITMPCWQWVLTRAVFLYGCLIGLSFLFIDYQKLWVGSHIRESRYLQPKSFAKFVAFLDSPQSTDPSVLKEYVYYYESVLRHVGERADAYAIVGVLEYYLGQPSKALQRFQRAIDLSPRIFWYYYNAGIIAYQQGYEEEAIGYLKQGLGQNPKHTLSLMSAESPAYGPLLSMAGMTPAMLSNHLRAGYRDGYRLLALIYYNNEENVDLLKISNQAIAANVGALDIFHLYAGVASYRLGKYVQASAYFSKAVELNRTLQAAYELKSLAQEALKSKEKSKNLGLSSSLELYFLRKEDLDLRVY
jgi:tetratricopeptide (TPR) repeat protein